MDKRTALVTGGNRGIGLEVARQLIARGLRVVLGVRDEGAGHVAAADLAGDPSSVPIIVMDLLAPPSIRDGIAALAERGERIDVLVNNAGILLSGAAIDCSPADVARSMQVNALAPAALARALAPGMVERGYGRIVNVSSVYGSFGEGLEGSLPYAMSKAAQNALTLKLAQELPDPVKVNACCPGWCRTRLGGPEARRSAGDGAETIVWLATLADDGPSGGFFRDRRPVPW